LSVVSGQLSVGAKHLEDKLSVIAKNSSPNASPVQLSVVSRQLSITNHQLPITNYQLPITNHQSPITNHQLPITNYQYNIWQLINLILRYLALVKSRSVLKKN
jgi:hypothetical protein